uniref:3-oxosteroid 1-dehydrogenase n=1 Tax=Comamonas testosteroni TaxID=285 RepID=3O1D_COMTE|nr:RecName: Full=3-oxosteroid 1-dehydrogenase [Comamonas testosteroni]AAA25679.1 3-oxosteroid delta-1-dehydrogenase [Comamonas testosteroni]
MAEQEYDLIVVGSGAGACWAPIRAQEQGLKTLVVEKTELFGGTSALSGGGIWIPLNYDQKTAGIKDDLETAFGYMKRCVRGMATDDRVLAYVETASKMAEYLRQIGIPYRAMAKYADYYPHIEGSRPGGRTMDPVDFNAARLRVTALETMRPGPPGNQLFGRMSISAFEAHSMLSRELKSRFTILGIMLKYFLDYPWRNKTRRDRRMTGGQALVAGLLTAANKARVEMWCNSPLKELVQDASGRVTGVIVERNGQRQQINARRGVLLGAGGFERNQEMRDQYLNKPTRLVDGNPCGRQYGDAHRAGQAWAHTGADGLVLGRAHHGCSQGAGLSRHFRGTLAAGVHGGQRQGAALPQRVRPVSGIPAAMLAENAKGNGGVPAWIVFDASFRAQNPMGPLMPGSAVPDSKVRKSWLNNVYWKGRRWKIWRADRRGRAGLQVSARRMTEYARAGKDLDFDRGGNVFDRYYGDPRLKNPNLGPIEKGPFYAMRLWPGEIGTKGGLLTDREGRVLDTQGRIIEGLYCVGNNSASVMAPAYAGAGSTLGPAMTFAFRAVADMVGKPLPLENPHLLGKTV